MRVAFAGTPVFALVALEALAAAGHHIALVLTQPDRPAGRGMKLQASPVKQFASSAGLPVAQPRSLRLDGKFPDDAQAARVALLGAEPEVIVVAAYGLILPSWVLELPPTGCLNVHGSLLPRWRGAAPIQRAIEAGDRTTGITIMCMDAGLDTGPILLEEALPIGVDDSAASLHDRLATLGAGLIVRALAQWPHLAARPQPAEGVTYAHKIDKAESAIDWRQPAIVIERRLRAFDPAPGSTATLGGEPLKIWRGRALRAPLASPDAAAPLAPGSLLDAGPERLVVACGEGALEILELQAPGARRGPALAWLRRRAARGA